MTSKTYPSGTYRPHILKVGRIVKGNDQNQVKVTKRIACPRDNLPSIGLEIVLYLSKAIAALVALPPMPLNEPKIA